MTIKQKIIQSLIHGITCIISGLILKYFNGIHPFTYVFDVWIGFNIYLFIHITTKNYNEKIH